MNNLMETEVDFLVQEPTDAETRGKPAANRVYASRTTKRRSKSI
jgi:hypothetical protein